MITKEYFEELMSHPKTQQSIVRVVKAHRKNIFATGGDVSLRKDGKKRWLYFREADHKYDHLAGYLDDFEHELLDEQKIKEIGDFLNGMDLKMFSGLRDYLKVAIEGDEVQRKGFCRMFMEFAKHPYLRDEKAPYTRNYIGGMHVHLFRSDKASEPDLDYVKYKKEPEFIISTGFKSETCISEINIGEHYAPTVYCVIMANPVISEDGSMEIMEYQTQDIWTGESYEDVTGRSLSSIPKMMVPGGAKYGVVEYSPVG